MIYYQQSSDSIAFSVDVDLQQRIIAWRTERGEPEHFVEDIMGTLHGHSLNYEFNVISQDAGLLRVNGVCFYASASTLEIVNVPKTTWGMYRGRTDDSKATIFSIDAEIYPYLKEWKNWDAEKAMTSKYSYQFSLDWSALDIQIERFSIYDRVSGGFFMINRDDYWGDLSYHAIDKPVFGCLVVLNK